MISKLSVHKGDILHACGQRQFDVCIALEVDSLDEVASWKLDDIGIVGMVYRDHLISSSSDRL